MINYRVSSDLVIESERLTFSAFRESDKEGMYSIQSNPKMVKFTPDEPWKSEQDWIDFYGFASTFYDEKKEWCPEWFRFFFAIKEKGCNRVVGYCGLGAPEYDRTVTEVFYGISPDYWGKGFATESAIAMLRFGFEVLKLDEIVGFREEGNSASGRVLEKAGLSLVGKLENIPKEFSYFEGEPLYKITAEEYHDRNRFMGHALYASKDVITLLYAEEVDRELVYNMAFEEDAIWQSMFECKEHFGWSEIRDEESHFFGREPGLCKYLLIEYDNQIVGTISHTYNDGKIRNMELDIWLRSVKYTGKGIGTKAIQLLVERLAEDYKIKTFIIRPWTKNPRAIRAYEKAGFVVADAFDPENYYGKYLEEWGQGDYPEEENCNMVLTIS